MSVPFCILLIKLKSLVNQIKVLFLRGGGLRASGGGDKTPWVSPGAPCLQSPWGRVAGTFTVSRGRGPGDRAEEG